MCRVPSWFTWVPNRPCPYPGQMSAPCYGHKLLAARGTGIMISWLIRGARGGDILGRECSLNLEVTNEGGRLRGQHLLVSARRIRRVRADAKARCHVPQGPHI